MQSPHLTEKTWRRLAQVAGLIMAIAFIIPRNPGYIRSSAAFWLINRLDEAWHLAAWGDWELIRFKIVDGIAFSFDYVLAILIGLTFLPSRNSPQRTRFWLKLLLAGRVIDSGSWALFWVMFGYSTVDDRCLALGCTGFVLGVNALAACRRGDRLIHVIFVNAFFLAHWFAWEFGPRGGYRDWPPIAYLAGAGSILLLLSVIGITKLHTQQTWGNAIRDLLLLRVGRYLPGRCPKCDYDLAGLPEPRCPECGAAFTWQDVGSQGPIEPAARA